MTSHAIIIISFKYIILYTSTKILIDPVKITAYTVENYCLYIF